MAKPFASLSPAGHQLSPPSLIIRSGEREEQEREMSQHISNNSNRWRGAPFTAHQWQELETQALVFKYFVAGVPVPPDLLLAVRASFESMAAARFYHHHSSLGYGGYFGKKIDPEPGRCRRTDGKKWRCAKEAAPDSKYCERHMHRGRNRSRKPVEPQLNPNPNPNSISVSVPSSPPASTLTSLNSSPVAMGNRNNGNGNYGVGNTGSGSYMSFGGSAGVHLQMDHGSYRYPYGIVKTSMDEPSLFSPFSLTETNNNNAYQFHNNNSFMTSDYSRPVVTKQEHNLRPFFDEWPRQRDESDYSFSSTQLSMSIPMASPDFSTPSSRSPGDD